VDFAADETLPFTVSCNGWSGVAKNGVSFCQAPVGLIQRVRTNVPVKWEAGSNCKVKSTDHNVFDFTVTAGYCVFGMLDEQGNYGRLTLRGYDQLEKEQN
jgi:hypothetical protein